MGSPIDVDLVRETGKGVAAGLLGAVVPNVWSLDAADAAIVHAMRDIAVDLSPAIFLNALMSALIPAIITLRRHRRSRASAGSRPLRSLAGPAAVVLCLATGGTVAALGTIYAVTLAFSLSGLAAPGVLLVRALQAALVATVLTPLTIVLLSPKVAQG